MEHTNGLMENNTKANLKMIKKTAMENSCGVMARSLKAIGLMESLKGWEYS